MFNQCKHKWQVLDKTTIPSKMAVYDAHSESLRGVRTSALPLDFDSLLKETVVITMSCEKCGKLEIIKETN